MSSPLNSGFVVDETVIPTGQALFFGNWPHPTSLPSPAQVRQTPEGAHSLKHADVSRNRQQVICFPDLQLVVKYGQISTTPVSEGQTLWLLSFLPHMRVPKVYGWCEDGGQRFIYMEYIEGITAKKRWPSLSAPEKLAVAEQLNLMISSMRCMKQAPGNTYIGALHRGVLHEQVWDSTRPGPFEDVKAFTDQLFYLGKNLPGYPDHPWITSRRQVFSDQASILFTHADLHLANIIISTTSTEILAVIDWHEAGWYPEFWEYIKSHWTNEWWIAGNDWKDYVPIAFQPSYVKKSDAFEEYAGTGIIL